MELFSQPHTSVSLPPVKEWPVPTEDPTAALDVLENTNSLVTVRNWLLCTTLPQLQTFTGTLFYLTTHLYFSLEAVLPDGRACTAYCCSNLPQVGVQVLYLTMHCSQYHVFTHNIWRRYWKFLPSAPSARKNVSLLTNTLFIRHQSSTRFGKSSKPVGSEEQELWDAIISLHKARKCTL
jgi:hypothetical protein